MASAPGKIQPAGSHLVAVGIAWLVLFSLSGQAAVGAGENSTPRLLTVAEGRIIVHAAWEHQQQLTGKPDCSHLVNEIYRLAGYPYAYASSFDLYNGGSENFARVSRPQPGDLVIWPGHVGLVVDPAQHSFYSSVTSGLDTQDYESKYWRNYGPSRFYRYRITSAESIHPFADRQADETLDVPERVQIVTVPVIDDEEADGPAAAPAPAKPDFSTRRTSIPKESSRAVRAESISGEAPRSILLVTRGNKPSKQEVSEAIRELSNSTRAALRAEDLLQPRLPVTVFEGLRVESVHVKGKQGWASVTVTLRASLSSGKREAKRRQEKRRWELRRSAAGWSALAPADRIYVPRDAAVRVLAGHLSKLAANEKSSRESAALLQQEAQLAGLLNDLLKN